MTIFAKAHRSALLFPPVAAAIGCGHGPVQAKAAPAAVAPPVAVEAGLTETAAAPPAENVGPRWRREDGCARDWAPSGDPVKDVVALGALCAQGTVPVLPEAAVVRVLAGRSARVDFTPTKLPSCLHVTAAATTGGLSVSLRGPAGNAIAGIWSNDGAVLAPPDGPVCVRDAGTYQAVVSVTPADASNAEARVAVQIWRAGSD